MLIQILMAVVLLSQAQVDPQPSTSEAVSGEAASEATTTPAAVSSFNYNGGRHERCSSFINSQGEIGEWGRELIRSIDRVGRDCFYNSPVFNNLCPRFSSLSITDKQKFVVYFWAYIADMEAFVLPQSLENIESTRCDVSYERRREPYSLVGLMRLESGAHFRRRAGRSRTFCGAGDEKSIPFQMQCSASMFADLHCQSNIRLSRSYWGSLRDMNRRDVDAFKSFPGCR